jgi:hypothetical protein
MKLPKLPDPRTRDGVKTIVRFIVARATSITIVAIIDQNLETEELSAYKNAGVIIGSHVLGEMVADATHEYVDNKVDYFAELFTTAKETAEAQFEIEAPTD